MPVWYYISVFIHVLSAAFWIGGMLFLPLVILPGIKDNPDRVAILHKTGIKFRFYGWLALSLLLLSGLMNMHFRGIPFSLEYFFSSNYGILITYKLLIFMLILLISSLHDFLFGRKALAQMKQSERNRLRLVARWSGRINLLLAMIAAFLGIAISRGGF